MATKIITKNSSTTTAIPTAGDLVQGELAVNVTDKRLFTEDSGGAIVELGTNPSTLTSGAATFSGNVGIAGQASPTYKLDGGFADQTWGWYLNSSYNAGFTFNTTERSLLIHTKSAENIDHIKFATGGTATERMRIDASGNLGLGVTPSAWAGTSHGSMDFGVTGAVNADLQVGVNLSQNMYWTGAAWTNKSASYATSYYNQSNDGHEWYFNTAAALGTFTPTRRMKLDQSGNLGIGVTPSASAEPMIEVGNAGSSLVGRGPADTRILSGLYFDTSGTYKYTQSGVPAGEYSMTNGYHSWSTAPSGSVGAAASPVATMYLAGNGNLRLNNLDAGNYRFKVAYNGASEEGIGLQSTYTSGNMIRFINSAGSTVGLIDSTASSTAYSTSSDYRLKEDVVPMTGATDRVKALRPINFAWKVDGSRTDGFLAHEAQEVVPEAVHGSKDAMRDEEYEVTPAVEEVRDEDGNVTTEAVAAVMGTRSVPDYQGIDQSKLVPLLTATIQELIARIEALEGA
jgi:hypothetical protein